MVPAAEAKITRQMPRFENVWVSIAGVVANDFGSLVWFLSFASSDSLPYAKPPGEDSPDIVFLRLSDEVRFVDSGGI